MVHLNMDEQIALLHYLGSVYVKNPNPMQLALCSREEKTLYFAYDLYVNVNRILQKMNCEYAQIIKNDFLVVKRSYWWKDAYTPKMYEQIKNIAMDEFFHCLYE